MPDANAPWTTAGGPRVRVISDNDYSGDPDGLVQLAHHALSTSVDLRCVIGSHLRPGDGFDPSDTTADNAAAKALTVLELAGRTDVRVVAGSNVGLTDRHTPIDSAAVREIIAEAHAGSTLPLYVCGGAGLTEIASAWLMDPTISSTLTVVWIGGAEYPGVEGPPGPDVAEYNTMIDPIAAQVVLTDSDLVVWQVPRSTYREALASFSEMQSWRATPVGDYLVDTLESVADMTWSFGLNIGETYVIGDSPLVLLTALQSSFEAWPSSSKSRLLPAPVLDDAGAYTGNVLSDRTIRVWHDLDMRLLMADLHAKLTLSKR
jgi:hypothetical protein